MSYVVTVASDVECRDQGKAVMTSSAKLTVAAHAVVTKSELLAATGLATSCVQKTNPNTGSHQCTQVLSLLGSSPGQSSRLTVGGVAVLLDSFAGQTDGNPNNQVSCKDAKQQKLTAT